MSLERFTLIWKGETVIIRIFFMVNRKDDGRINLKEFKKSNLFSVLQQVAAEEDINKVTY